MNNILILIVILTSQVTTALEIAGAKFNETVNVGRASLTLNGIGLRKATIFGVKVYAAGLYVTQPSKEAKEILEAQWPVQLQMEFLRDVDAKKISEAWEKSFKENCEKDCEKLTPRIFLLKGMMPSVKKGDRMVYTFQESGVDISLNGKPLGDVAHADFSRFLLSTWLGKKPPTEDLKKGLLGIAP